LFYSRKFFFDLGNIFLNIVTNTHNMKRKARKTINPITGSNKETVIIAKEAREVYIISIIKKNIQLCLIKPIIVVFITLFCIVFRKALSFFISRRGSLNGNVN